MTSLLSSPGSTLLYLYTSRYLQQCHEVLHIRGKLQEHYKAAKTFSLDAHISISKEEQWWQVEANQHGGRDTQEASCHITFDLFGNKAHSCYLMIRFCHRNIRSTILSDTEKVEVQKCMRCGTRSMSINSIPLLSSKSKGYSTAT